MHIGLSVPDPLSVLVLVSEGKNHTPEVKLLDPSSEDLFFMRHPSVCGSVTPVDDVCVWLYT